MNFQNIGNHSLTNLGQINIVLGKNGCGKSRLMRDLSVYIAGRTSEYGKVAYITPERGGALVFNANIETQTANNTTYISSDRGRNRTDNFRQQSVMHYRKLKEIILEEIETDKRADTTYTFNLYIEKINGLLDNLKVVRAGTTFKMFDKASGNEVPAEQISSGESELISLAIECLIFSKEAIPNKENILLLDEPDAHLHPDLQARFVAFLEEIVAEGRVRMLITTHSTAILGALTESVAAHVCFMTKDQKELEFKKIGEIYKRVLPIFGAHPLSNIFNEAPVLLVEGEDDERIWQQAVRSSQGKVQLFPCPTDTVSKMNEYEVETQNILKSVYDSAKGYSLRDRDGLEGELQDLLPIVRLRLSCRASENLLLTDESLQKISQTWEHAKKLICLWLESNAFHPHFGVMKKFEEGGFDRMGFDLKDIRNDLMGIFGSEKPWEVIVGQVVAALTWDEKSVFDQEGKIFSFLGEKVVKSLLPHK